MIQHLPYLIGNGSNGNIFHAEIVTAARQIDMPMNTGAAGQA